VITFDPAALETEAAQLEQEMAVPGFWEDRTHAAEVSRHLERARSLLTRYNTLNEEAEEVELLHQMAVEMAGGG